MILWWNIQQPLLQTSVSHDLQKSIWYPDVLLKKHLYYCQCFSGFLMTRKLKGTGLIWNKKNCNIINAFTLDFDKCKISMPNKDFKKYLIEPNFWMDMYRTTYTVCVYIYIYNIFFCVCVCVEGPLQADQHVWASLTSKGCIIKYYLTP